MKNITKKGFSLIELLVVVAIIGILAGIAIVGYNSYVDDANNSVAEANAKIIARKIAAEKASVADFASTALTGSSIVKTDRTTQTANNFIDAAKLYADSINIKNVTSDYEACGLSTDATNTADNGKIVIYGANSGVSVCFKVKDKAREIVKAY